MAARVDVPVPCSAVVAPPAMPVLFPGPAVSQSTHGLGCCGGVALRGLLLARRSALLALVLVLLAVPGARAAVPLTQLSTDPFTNTSSQHRTEVEPDTFSRGSIVVGAFQVGRFFDGGSSDIG